MQSLTSHLLSSLKHLSLQRQLSPTPAQISSSSLSASRSRLTVLSFFTSPRSLKRRLKKVKRKRSLSMSTPSTQTTAEASFTLSSKTEHSSFSTTTITQLPSSSTAQPTHLRLTVASRSFPARSPKASHLQKLTKGGGEND